MARPYKRSGGVSNRRVASAKALVAKARAALQAKNRGVSSGMLRSAGYWGRFSGKAGELKYKDQASATNIGINSTTGLCYGIVSDTAVGIPRGTGPNERIGRKLTIKKLMIKGMLRNVNSGDAAQAADVVRVIVFQDTQANGTLPALSNLLDAGNILSFNDLENSGRFRVLKEKKFVLNAQAGAGWSTQASYTQPPGVAATPNGGGFTAPATGNGVVFAEVLKPFEMYLNLTVPIELDGPNGTIAECKSNNLCLAFISQESHTQVTFRTRLRYLDN